MSDSVSKRKHQDGDPHGTLAQPIRNEKRALPTRRKEWLVIRDVSNVRAELGKAQQASTDLVRTTQPRASNVRSPKSLGIELSEHLDVRVSEPRARHSYMPRPNLGGDSTNQKKPTELPPVPPLFHARSGHATCEYSNQVPPRCATHCVRNVPQTHPHPTNTVPTRVPHRHHHHSRWTCSLSTC